MGLTTVFRKTPRIHSRELGDVIILLPQCICIRAGSCVQRGVAEAFPFCPLWHLSLGPAHSAPAFVITVCKLRLNVFTFNEKLLVSSDDGATFGVAAAFFCLM